MSKLSKALNEYFYPWGDSDSENKVWRNGRYVSLKKLYEYDDYVYYRPLRQKTGTAIVLGLVASGYGLYKGGSYLKTKYDKRKPYKEDSNLK